MDQDIKVNAKHYSFLGKDGADKRVTILFGGAGSGKSWSIAQYLLLEKFYKERGIGILVVRKTLPSLKSSALQLILNLMRKYKLPHKYNKTELTIQYRDNIMMFRSLDDVEKIKSIEGINYVWVEEATEISKVDFMQLNIRARAQNNNPGSINRLFLSFNPVDEKSFLKPITDNPPDDTAVMHSTYRDNSFLDELYIQELEKLIRQDKTYYLIYNKGMWASPGNIVYTNWRATTYWPNKFDHTSYGLDFGYNHPTALIEVNWKDGVVYERELIYQTKMTNQQLIEKLKVLIPMHMRYRQITADSAEPDRIEEIFKAGFNIHPAIKGPHSVKIGIDRVKRLDIRIWHGSVNIIDEKRSYKWKEDKYGNILDEVVQYKDHLMDAERYCLGQEMEAQPLVLVGGAYGFAN